KELEIIAAALELFMKYGIKSLTMDDIARHLHISKKTLYLYVNDKKDLVKKGMEFAISGKQETVCEAIGASATAIDELIGITRCVSASLGEMHPSVLYDIQKYHPFAWELLMKHKTEFIYGVMLDNLKRGVKEKYYRKNINPDVVASIYITMMDTIMNPEHPITKKMNIEKLHLEVINYHLNGICNQKGLVYLQAVIKKEQLILLSID
ncbi:MAG: TetR/AcrR family transcriptional regulator, partial [Flavobacteriales bacterium]|nr:TetR/AcrR family transcriptional regulator [Flavobacteriales bacterium]